MVDAFEMEKEIKRLKKELFEEKGLRKAWKDCVKLFKEELGLDIPEDFSAGISYRDENGWEKTIQDILNSDHFAVTFKKEPSYAQKGN